MKSIVVRGIMLSLIFILMTPWIRLDMVVMANPIPVPTLLMPYEYINVTLSLADGELLAKVNGTYPFTNVNYTLVRMDYPVPPNATNISVRMDGTSLYWTYNAKNYPTVIGDWPMIDWTISPIPDNFTVETYYEHPVPVIGGNRTFLYAMGTGRYLETYAKETTAYVRIRMETKYADLHVYTVGNASGTWAWKPAQYTIAKEDTADVIVLNVTSQLFTPLKDDLLVTFTPASTTVSVSPATREVNVGEKFNVAVNVADVVDLHDLQFRFAWNGSILNVSDAIEGDFLSREGNPTFFFKEVSIAPHTIANMYVGCTLLGNATGVSGNGTIASITFLAIAPGKTSLDISETSYREIGGNVTVKGAPTSSVLSKENFQACKLQSTKVAAWKDPLWDVRNPSNPNTFPTLQAAINSPNVANGDTIHVFAGVDGPTIVTKTLRIIGEGIAVTTINGGGANSVTIRADNVFITEFTITGGNAGILCATWNGLTVSNNDISGNVVGVALFKSTSDTILGNSITNNICGLLLWRSTSVMVRANEISSNVVGIQLLPPVTGNIYYNNFVSNTLHCWPIGCAAPGITIVWDDNGIYGAFKGNYWALPPVPCPGDRGPLSGPWMGKKEDVNLDGTINIIDISTAAAAFGTKWSDPRWNPKADVDGNGRIDILDLARIAKLFGWKDP